MIDTPVGGIAVDYFDTPQGAIASAAREGIVLVDEAQVVVALNAAALSMFGYAQTEIVGQPLDMLIPERLRAIHAEHVRAFVASAQIEPRGMRAPSIRGLRADGQVFPAEASILRVDLPHDGTTRPYFVAMLRDLSVDSELRADVLTLTARLRAVLDMAPVAMWIVEGDRVVYANRATVELFGMPDAASLFGESIHALLHPDEPGALPAHLTSALVSRSKPSVLTGTIVRRDGGLRQVEIATTALPDHGRTVLQMAITDVTQRSAQALEQSQHRLELRRLAASVVEAREEERRRIARELHDELGQRLTALKMEIASLRSHDQQRKQGSRFDGMIEMVDNTVAALRRIAADLRPLMLDDLGLSAAIEWLARDAARRMDIEVTVHLQGEDPLLAPGADIALYRMVQEALTNVGRHAHATGARIELRQEGAELVLVVQDNGRGFPERAVGQDGRYGLLGIRERAIMLGGRLEVDNPPAGGGRITVRVPLRTAAIEGGPPS